MKKARKGFRFLSGWWCPVCAQFFQISVHCAHRTHPNTKPGTGKLP